MSETAHSEMPAAGAGGERPMAAARRSPWVPAIAAWLVPGAGHLLIGRRWPALFVAAAVLPLFFGGMALAGFVNVNPAVHRWTFAAQVLAGGPALVGAGLLARPALAEFPPYGTAGELYTAIAGLLNLVAIADVWARCRHGDPPAPGDAAAAPRTDSGDDEFEPRDVLAAEPAVPGAQEPPRA